MSLSGSAKGEQEGRDDDRDLHGCLCVLKCFGVDLMSFGDGRVRSVWKAMWSLVVDPVSRRDGGKKESRVERKSVLIWTVSLHMLAWISTGSKQRAQMTQILIHAAMTTTLRVA